MIIKNIQILRALAANGVVLSHLLKVEGKYGHGIQVLPQSAALGSYGVDLFFVISGFIMAVIMRGSWREFLFSRMTRIYPTYWFYTTIVLIVSLIKPSLVNNSFNGLNPVLWKSYLLFPDITLPLLQVGWTLVHEMYFYIGFSIILALGLSLQRGLFTWAVLVLGASVVLDNSIHITIPLIKIIFSPMTLEFIMGAFIGILIRNKVQAPALPMLAFGIIGLFAGLSFCVTHQTWDNIYMIGIPCSLIVYGSATWEQYHPTQSLNWLVRLGDASYSTYLSHILVISAIGYIFVTQPIHNWYTEAMFVFIGLIGSNIIGLLSYQFIERPLIRFTRNILRCKQTTMVPQGHQ